MAEQYGATTCDLKECHGTFGLFACRITNCTNADTLTLPVKRIVSVVGHDETTANVLKLAVATNVITITCTTNDEVNIWALCEK